MAEMTTPAVADSDSSITTIWFSFEGRSSRSTYWVKYFLPWFGISFVANIIDAMVGTGGVLALIVAVIGLWPGLANSVKRCHDRDRSGWFLLLGLIPLVNLWVLVEVWFLRGTIGENRFGPDPVVD